MKLLKKYDHPIKIYHCFNCLPLSFDILYIKMIDFSQQPYLDSYNILRVRHKKKCIWLKNSETISPHCQVWITNETNRWWNRSGIDFMDGSIKPRVGVVWYIRNFVPDSAKNKSPQIPSCTTKEWNPRKNCTGCYFFWWKLCFLKKRRFGSHIVQ